MRTLLIVALVAATAPEAHADPGDIVTPTGVISAPPRVAPFAPKLDETWTAVGAIADRAGHKGGRLQADIFGGRHWALGFSAALLQDGDTVMNVQVPRAVGSVYAAVTVGVIGPLHVRAQVGVGGTLSLDATQSSVLAGQQPVTTSKFVESALLAHIEFAQRWAIVGGLVAHANSVDAAMTDPTAVVAFAGLQHR